MTFREGFLIFLQASNGCKEIKMYFFINFSIISSSDFFIIIHIFTSLRTTEQQRHRTASSKMPSCYIRTHNEHACSKHPNVPADYFKGRNFRGRNFRNFAIFGQIRESLFPQNICYL